MIMVNVIFVVVWIHLYLFYLFDVNAGQKKKNSEDPETTGKRVCVVCACTFTCRHIYIRGDDCFPSCCSLSSSAHERFDLPTFIFLLTFLKNLATLWEVWLDWFSREFKQHIGGQYPPFLITSIPFLPTARRDRGHCLQKKDWGN